MPRRRTPAPRRRTAAPRAAPPACRSRPSRRRSRSRRSCPTRSRASPTRFRRPSPRPRGHRRITGPGRTAIRSPACRAASVWATRCSGSSCPRVRRRRTPSRTPRDARRAAPPRPAPASPGPAPVRAPGPTPGPGTSPTTGPTPPAPSRQPTVEAATAEPKPEGNAIYRIDHDGFVTEIFRQPVLILSMVEREGQAAARDRQRGAGLPGEPGGGGDAGRREGRAEADHVPAAGDRRARLPRHGQRRRHRGDEQRLRREGDVHQPGAGRDADQPVRQGAPARVARRRGRRSPSRPAAATCTTPPRRAGRSGPTRRR